MKRIVNALLALCTMTVTALPAQRFTNLFSFDFADGSSPLSALVQATDGNLYGATYYGGAYQGGTIFRIAPGGTLITLYNFCAEGYPCPDGASPSAPLVQGTDGNLYGTTYYGGAYDEGTVFQITTDGTLKTLYSFCAAGLPDCTDGAYPYASLAQATNGDFYGTTEQGGAYGVGTIFKITSSGQVTTLYSFCAQSGCPDGAYPQGGLVQTADGNFYSTTISGGAYDQGVIFRMTPSGALKTLYSFCAQSGCADGASPYAGLVQTADGELYGTTYFGGAHNRGTVFKTTPDGTLKTLYSFCNNSGCPHGAYPNAPLIQATDGDFYGTTSVGGADHAGYLGGTVFKITSTGTLTTLYSFCAQSDCSDGRDVPAGLFQATNGRFYGTTSQGGSFRTCIHGCGTVFSLSMGLGPFVQPQTTSGRPGATVNILGGDLTGASSVTFNGAAAEFAVDSSGTAIAAIVPVRATTGLIHVVTPSGTLSSNVPFRVLP